MARIGILDDYQEVSLKMADWSIISQGNDVQVFKDHLSDPDAVVNRLKEFDVVVAMRERTPFPRSILAQLPNLKLLVTTGMRNRSVDMEASAELGITVCGTSGQSYATAELTWGLILSLARCIPAEDAATRQGKWQVTVGEGLKSKTLGVLGLGNLGSQVATVGNAFGMNVVAWSQNLTEERAAQFGTTLVSKEELLSTADIVTIHLILSQRTRGLLGAKELALLKPTAYLVNTSRGPIVDEAALVDVLERGAIGGAAMDVFDEEPLPVDHPLRRMENTVITPHLGYVTKETYLNYFGQAVEDIQAFLAGEPVRVLEAV
ncbi:MAG: D-2-hydroxyacid dehydrogenase family protein [Dehalococcoidia bacterium]|nr:D-2-hydroxyacid dehydrogenase family protein [Dehalococcoidia bacterium]